MRVYISGPMTGIENMNSPAFHEAAVKLRAAGHTPLNPANCPAGLEYRHYMDIAMAMVRSSERIYTLKGWSKSPGARAEVAYAKSIGIEMIYLTKN